MGATSPSEQARQEIVQAAKALLKGQLSALRAAQRIASLRYDLDPEQKDEDLLMFADIDSDTDYVTVSDSLRGWHPAVRAQKERDLASAEAFHKEAALRSAEALVAKYDRLA